MRINFLFIIAFILTVSLTLSGCSHVPLKSPCGPTASIDDNPCGHIPVNLASLTALKSPFKSPLKKDLS